MISVKHGGNFNNLEAFLERSKQNRYQQILSRYGQRGVTELSNATPVDSGVTADSWGYKTTISKGKCTISWTNSSVNDGVPIIILLHYGHATGNGGYIQGRNFINPVIAPIFDQIAEDLWKEVTG